MKNAYTQVHPKRLIGSTGVRLVAERTNEFALEAFPLCISKDAVIKYLLAVPVAGPARSIGRNGHLKARTGCWLT